jgi:hypothetical protein
MNKSMRILQKRPIAACLVTGWILLVGTGAILARAASPDKKADMKTMVENAKTAQDHRAIAALYDSQAEQAKAKAAEHIEMAKWYRSWRRINKTMVSYKNPQHCERLAKSYSDQAAEYLALASEHEAIASEIEKNAK